MSEKPRISVLLPVKNRLEHFTKALNSILEQSFEDFELIIVDDSETGIESYLINDVRLKYYRGSNVNLAAALNFGLSKCSCDLIARMDGDDFCSRDRLEKQIAYIKANNLHATGCNLVYVGEDDRVILKKRFPENSRSVGFYMPVTTSLPHPTLMTYKSVLEKAGGYDENLKFAEDQDLFLRMIKSGSRFGNIQEFLYFYRIRVEMMNTYNEDSNAGYKIGMNYILEREKGASIPEIKNETLLQKALVEYYKGDARKAAKHFIRLFRKKPALSIKYGRHFLLSIGGNSLLRFLRKNKLPQRMNFFVIKHLDHDMQFINRGK